MKFDLSDGRHRLVALATTTKESTMLTRFYDSKIFPIWAAIRAFFHFLHHIMWQMAQGCYPVVGHYRADYDCDEHYFLAWYMPETSKLKLDYYYLMDYRDGRKFVYSKDTHVNNTDYDDICF